MIGNQAPTFSTVGEYAYSNGDLVADMFEEDADATFYGAQRYELEIMLARDEDGAPAATTIGISRARQNGKSYGARYYSCYSSDFEHKAVLYSAHNGSTTRKMFREILALYDNPERFPEFAKNVKEISRSRGYEGIYFKDWTDSEGLKHPGGYVEFSTRTNSGARGGTYNVIIIDEAQELTDDQQEAMLPVISAAADANDERMRPQIIMIGTPPSPTCNGTVFRRTHDRAHKGATKGVWWIEWAVMSDSIDALELNEKNVMKLARMTNPALGIRIAESTIMNEFSQMSKDGFCRERLGWWSNNVVIENYAIDKEKWKECASTRAKPEGKTAYGVKFSADGSVVFLCGAVCPDKEPARISLIEERNTGRGIAWLAEWLNARYKTASCVVIDGRNGVEYLIEQISTVWKIKGSVIKPSAKDVVAAASQLVNEVNEKKVTWYQYQEEMDDSAKTSVKRPIAGGWGFGGDNAGPIEAASLALWGCRTSKRNPQKKQRIG